MQKIAVFGSAFNPPSLGHKSVIQSLSHYDRVLLEPSFAHAWGKKMLDYTLRCELLDRFIDDIDLVNVQRSQVEPELFEPEKGVTTFALLSQLERLYPDTELTFVMGPDNFFHFAKFYKAEDILKKWSVIAYPEKVAIRSTDIRNALIDNQSITHLTTPSVAKQLQQQGLYMEKG